MANCCPLKVFLDYALFLQTLVITYLSCIIEKLRLTFIQGWWRKLASMRNRRAIAVSLRRTWRRSQRHDYPSHLPVGHHQLTISSRLYTNSRAETLHATGTTWWEWRWRGIILTWLLRGQWTERNMAFRRRKDTQALKGTSIDWMLFTTEIMIDQLLEHHFGTASHNSPQLASIDDMARYTRLTTRCNP